MKKLFQTIREALSRGERAALCMVIDSSGSAPRGAGAKLAVFEDGSVLGTVGGGKVEALAMEQAGLCLQNGVSLVRRFDLGVGGDTGMICGGSVQIAFCCLQPQQDWEVLSQICRSFEEREAAWLVLELGHLRLGLSRQKGLKPVPVLEESQYVEPLVQQDTVYLFGCGHVSLEVAPLLAHVGFRVVVMDSRPALATRERFPDAERIICGDFSDIYAHLSIGQADYAIIMTPGHEADFEVLRQVLQSPAQYIGCIGSRMKIAKTRQRLAEEGFTQAQIDRLTAPIGLPIGSETPAEIAVSVAAQLIAHRAARRKAV